MRNRAGVVAGAVAFVVAVLLAACGSTADSDGGTSKGFGSQDATADVTVSACSTTRQYGFSNVKGGTYTITNHSDGVSDYYIEVNIERDGVILGTGNAGANHVAPGQSAEGKLAALLDGNPPAGPCEFVITTVQRTATA
jgi:hypothetical protein